MNLYTSYFAKYKGPSGVCITCRKPYWFKGKHLPELGPTADLLQAYKTSQVNQDEYTQKFLLLMEKVDWTKVESQLCENDVLLCYEGPNKFCHRHIVADLLRKRGHTVTEL